MKFSYIALHFLSASPGKQRLSQCVRAKKSPGFRRGMQ